MAKRRDTETFSLSFLDVICCGFGAVILLLVITKIYEPITIEQSQLKRKGLLAALQEELFEIRGETVILNRGLKTVEEELAEEEDLETRLRKELTAIRGQFATTQDEASIDDDKQGELLAARQMLTEEMKRLLKLYKRPDDDTTVGGIPVDSEYIIFVIDTSGSMLGQSWDLAQKMLRQTLQAYPVVKGIQVMNDMGKYMFTSFAGRWIPDTANGRKLILNYLRSWTPFSNSSPVEGITKAIQTFTPKYRDISIYVMGDEFTGPSIQSVVDTVDQLNAAGVVRIHGLGFPFKGENGDLYHTVHRFATLMRVLCQRNGGTFVALGRES